VSFKACGINHERIRRVALCHQVTEYLIKYAQTAPPDETIVYGFVWPILRRRIAPTQSAFDNEYNPRYNAAVINTRHAMRQRKKWLNLGKLLWTKPEPITRSKAPLPNMNTIYKVWESLKLIGPEPNRESKTKALIVNN